MAGFLTMTTVVIAQALFLQDGDWLRWARMFSTSAPSRVSAATECSGSWREVLPRANGCSLRIPFRVGLADGVRGVLRDPDRSFRGHPLRIGLTTMLGYHALVGIIEGMLTAGVLSFLLKVRPDLMKMNEPGASVLRLGGRRVFVAIPALILILAGSSSLPDPLETLLPALRCSRAAHRNAGLVGAVPGLPPPGCRFRHPGRFGFPGRVPGRRRHKS